MSGSSLRLMKLNAWLSLPPAQIPGAARVRVVCYDEWNHAVILLIALAKGFFAEGPQVELVTVEGHAGEADEIEIRGLAYGLWDVALDTLTMKMLAAREGGVPISIVGARRRTHAFVLIGRNEIKSIADLKGGKIIACSPNDEMDLQCRQLLRDQGLKADQDVEILYAGLLHDLGAMESSFRHGEGAGLMATLPQGRQLEKEGYPVLADLNRLYPPRHDRVMVAREPFLRERPAAMKAFLKGFVRANRYFLDRSHRSEIEEIVTESGILPRDHDREVFATIFEALYERVPAQPVIEEEGLRALVEEGVAKGELRRASNPSDVLKLDAMREVLVESL